MRNPTLPILAAVFALLCLVRAFTSEDHEIFRLRDELAAAEGPDVTFYDFVGVSPSASHDDITKAFRKKSRAIHPDKAKNSFIASRSTPAPKKPGEKRKPSSHVSKGPSQREISHVVKKATERYQRLGVVAKLLRSEDRERYDHFLRHGFPAWRGTGYYYSRYRPGLGTVLLGLFLVGGGAAHYGALLISYNRQREFMDKYIRSARKQAWGNESGVPGLNGLNTASGRSSPEPDDAQDTANMNRRQKRELAKQAKKENKSGRSSRAPSQSRSTGRVLGTGEEIEYGSSNIPVGAKRRVVAENGKVLIVDSIGNVFLEEEDEEGQIHEFLLDLSEIHKPTVYDTAVLRLPIWAWRKAFDPFLKTSSKPIESVPATPVVEYERLRPAPKTEVVNTSTLPSTTSQVAVDLSSSQASLGDFEIIDSTGVESAPQGLGTKKRAKKSKK